MTTIKIDTTKRGFAAMWESGGGMTSGGSAQIITGRNGEARRPIYMPRGGHLCCGNHALVGVADGFYIVSASVRRGSRDSASIRRIVSTSVKDVDGASWQATAEVEEVNTFSRGEWDKPLEEKFSKAVEAAFQKASSYHCRSTYYIDYSDKPELGDAEKARRAAEQARQDAERAAFRQAKADAEAKAKAEAEVASKAAKEAGLGARLDAVNIRLAALERELVGQGEASFKWGWQSQLYSEQAVAGVERQVATIEAQKAEQERKRRERETFQPKFEAFVPRATALGLTLEFTDDSARLEEDGYGQPYSEEGVAKFVADLDRRERESAEAKVKAMAEALYQERKTEAAALELPTDIRIWCRRGGRTNAGDGWVIGADGQDRGNTAWYNPRLRYGHEGDKIWEQVLPGEVVLKWSKGCSAAEHEFEVVYLPPEGITEAQLERILEIQEELEREWEGVRGLASGILSPSVGRGWGLCKKTEPTTSSSGGTLALADLQARFANRHNKM
ncbi:MAG: hypothetical protein HZA35_03170 [Parcubacteria group bacterium]|nr:hypothetical protein [Parcubacteria group bacterium]